MTHAYSCGPSYEDDRPEIDFDDEFNAANDWLTIGEVIDGTLSEDHYPAKVVIKVNDPRATDWHCYMDGGLGGLFSARFIECVESDALERFSLFPAQLNSAEYFFLRCDDPLDCLDRRQSTFEVFPHDPSRIMHITHYSFVDDRIPDGILFCIPDAHRLFATPAIADKVARAQLKGVLFSELP